MSKTKKKAPQKRKPPSAPKEDPPAVQNLAPSLCPNCRSDKRAKYNNTDTREGPVRVGGIVYAKIETRRTHCLDCGRRRIDRFLYPMSGAE